jgi:hypothetical protein
MQKKKNQLELLLQNARKEIFTLPIRSLGVLIATSSPLLLLTNKSTRGYLLQLLLVSIPISIALIIFVSIILITLLTIISFSYRKNKDTVEFFNHKNFTWKINKIDKISHVESTPYCNIHKIKFLSENSEDCRTENAKHIPFYTCPLCEEDNKVKYDNNNIVKLHKEINNIFSARDDGHVRVLEVGV